MAGGQRRVLRLLHGCHGDGLGWRHGGGDAGEMAAHDAIDVAVEGKHGDQRSQDTAEEGEVDHERHVDNGDERARRALDELIQFACRTNTFLCDPILMSDYIRQPLADLGFLEGGDFGNPSERSERALRGSGLTGEGFGSRRGTKQHRNNISHTLTNRLT